MTTSTVRLSRPADAAEVIRLAATMYRAMGLDASGLAWRAEAGRMIRERAGSEDCAVFVAEDEGRLVSCGGVTIAARLPGPRVANARFAYIQWMVTDPEYRRRGHARAVLEAILEWVRKRGVRIVELHATPEGESLYRSYGFEDPPFPQLRAEVEDERRNLPAAEGADNEAISAPPDLDSDNEGSAVPAESEAGSVIGPVEVPGPIAAEIDSFAASSRVFRQMRRPKPVILEGALIRLEPLAGHHLPELQAAGDQDPSLFRFIPSDPYRRGGWDAWLAEALEGQAQGRYVCWATIERTTGKAIGSTRFADIEPDHGRLEIGWTWLAPSHQGTGANTEAKLLQLQYAFDVLGAGRVAFRTDARNARSRRAIERLGGMQEGVLRRHIRMPDGFVRDTVYYSILSDEWPAVRARLQARLTRMK